MVPQIYVHAFGHGTQTHYHIWQKEVGGIAKNLSWSDVATIPVAHATIRIWVTQVSLPPQSLRRECNPAGLLISDFWPPECRRAHLCVGSQNTLLWQPGNWDRVLATVWPQPSYCVWDLPYPKRKVLGKCHDPWNNAWMCPFHSCTQARRLWQESLQFGDSSEGRNLVTARLSTFLLNHSSSNHNGESVICNTQIVISDNGPHLSVESNDRADRSLICAVTFPFITVHVQAFRGLSRGAVIPPGCWICWPRVLFPNFTSISAFSGQQEPGWAELSLCFHKVTKRVLRGVQHVLLWSSAAKMSLPEQLYSHQAIKTSPRQPSGSEFFSSTSWEFARGTMQRSSYCFLATTPTERMSRAHSAPTSVIWRKLCQKESLV